MRFRLGGPGHRGSMGARCGTALGGSSKDEYMDPFPKPWYEPNLLATLLLTHRF